MGGFLIFLFIFLIIYIGRNKLIDDGVKTASLIVFGLLSVLCLFL